MLRGFPWLSITYRCTSHGSTEWRSEYASIRIQTLLRKDKKQHVRNLTEEAESFRLVNYRFPETAELSLTTAVRSFIEISSQDTMGHTRIRLNI